MRRKFGFAAVTFVLTGMVLVAEVAAQTPAVQWQRTYGGIGNTMDGMGNDVALSMVQTVDGGYAIAGFLDYDGGRGVPWLVKTDAYGNEQWNKTYARRSDTFELRSVIQTIDGGYALAGMFATACLVKTDANGNTLWNKTYGTAQAPRNYFQSIVQTADGGYAMAGLFLSLSDWNYDVWLVKTDANGNVQLSKTYEMGQDRIFDVYALVQTADKGFAIGGTIEIFGEGRDFLLIRTDANGNALWSKNYGGPEHNYGEALVQTSDGGYALAGGYLFVKTDAYGNEQWNKTLTNVVIVKSMIQTSDGGYALAGGPSHYFLLKTDAAGNTLWSKDYGGTSFDNVISVVQAVDGGYAMVGSTSPQILYGCDVLLMKTEPYVIPEFPSVLLMMLMIMPLLAGTLYFRKKLLKTRSSQESC